MTGSGQARELASAKPPIQFIPRQPDDTRATVHIVRRQRRGDEGTKEGLHLVRRQWFSRFHRRLAGDGGDQQFVAGMRRGAPVAAQRRQRLPQAA